MIEYDRLGLPRTGEEVTGKRTPNSKTFALGGKKFNLHITQGLVHYAGDGLEDIDLEPVDMGTHWLVDKAPYVLEIAKDKPEFLYRGKQSGLEVNVSLESIDGATAAGQCRSEQHNAGHSLCFDDLLGDGHLSIVMRSGQVQTEQRINSANGIKSLHWKILQNHPEPMVRETARRGRDAARKEAEILIERSSLLKKGNLWEHTFEERFTGKILEIADKRKRTKRSVEGVTYPVTIIS